MKREFLEELLKDLNPSSDVIDKIMKENGKDIEGAKAKFADYDDIKKQLEAANATIDKFKDYDTVKSDVEKYKAELKKSQEESAAKIAAMERSGKVKDYLSGKKFVNDITRDAIGARLGEMLADNTNAGKNLDDLFAELTKDKKNILEDTDAPKPPVVTKMGGGKPDAKADAVAKAREVMGLPPIKDGKEQ